MCKSHVAALLLGNRRSEVPLSKVRMVPGAMFRNMKPYQYFQRLTVANPCENKPKRNRLSCDELRPARTLPFPRSYRFSADLRQSHTEICSTACFGWKSANLMVRSVLEGALVSKAGRCFFGGDGALARQRNKNQRYDRIIRWER